MIALFDNLPVVQFADGRVVAFERDWLVRSLSNAARRAGYSKWWLAEHVAESVTNYLREQELNVLAIDRLTTAVRSVLQVIGYGEVGKHFEPAPQRVQVSLVELAVEAGSGYELAFFERLGGRIQRLLADQSCCFEFFGLEACVKLLRARKTWSRGCDALRAEIVSFARDRTGTAAAERDVFFALQ